MDLADAMKQGPAKTPNAGQVTASTSAHLINNTSTALIQSNDIPANIPGMGYVTEKLYMLLQLYLQNKGWSPTAELLQCFSELKDSSLLPSAAYLQ